jgi:hypothetical protein
MELFNTSIRYAAVFAALVSFSLLAQAQVEEDSSAAFSKANEAMEQALNLPSAESSVLIHANGMISARVGLDSMKMLVVRQNEDGSYSYGHASSESEAQAFVDSPSANQLEEK